MWRLLSWRFCRVGRGSSGLYIGEGLVKALMTGERPGFPGDVDCVEGMEVCRGHRARDGVLGPRVFEPRKGPDP